MVVFTCNHCGDSVKKPVVDKHFNTKCRGMVKNVTCMDCQKDFFNEEYVAHTQCITEAEKYSGKDYVPKEFKNNKKQESWMEIVRSILNNQEYKISAPARGVFEKLQSFDNVPRKKQKFQNFITKCVRVHQRQAVEVWNVLEKELEKMKASKAPETKVKTEEEELKSATLPHNGVKREVPNGNGLNEPPKKKSKKQEVNEPATVAATDLNSQQNGNSEPKKKKNKKQKTEAEAEVEGTTAGAIQNEVEQTQSNKKKSKKQKSENSIELTEPTSEIAEVAPSAIEASEEFRWQDVLSKIVNKQAEGILLEKLKKKILKKYMSKLEVTEMTEKEVQKFEKKFNKYLKRCEAVNVDGDLVKSA
ncbi:cell growth-regulating nucleolar protein [Teleopsis dalmanni]|uniref:cell growth-regulating nucleolar protein n=1 Tax=Teleopsis dalmanni TaxID=139649 RepID=UPI0018CD40F6|nr:cell growth-regulating nucleolar protein [Teleopsis dalmanni]